MLNAKELHDVYAPLWALVPETRPVQLTFNANAAPGEYTWFDGPSGCYTHQAANACRIAVEDWIRERRVFALMDHDADDVAHGECTEVYGFVPGDEGSYDPNDEVTNFSGPTIHHALVVTALAIHSAGPS